LSVLECIYVYVSVFECMLVYLSVCVGMCKWL